MSYLLELLELLEVRLLAACATSQRATDDPCGRAIGEHLEAGGARVRAAICLDAAVRLGLEEVDAVLVASVCELLHNASLIQDDLFDRTATRRGSPSVWTKYGDTVAVCAGDLMLSAAYRLLADLSSACLIGQAIRLVHLRASEVIVGEAAASFELAEGNAIEADYERSARGKSASLLSLALELPLLLSGHCEFTPLAHEAASDFAVAYQIADDLNDWDQDAQEGSSNLLLLLMQGEGLTLEQATVRAFELSNARLTSAELQAGRLPRQCASTLLQHAARLRGSLVRPMSTLAARAGV
jgi:geranylgeranyl diphosphate synthase type II